MSDGLVKGLDVSSWKRSVPWAKLKEKGYEFVYARASVGNEPDRWHERHASSAREMGFMVGHYHALLPMVPGQARRFYQSLARSNGFLDPLPPVLDVEAKGLVEEKVLLFLNAFRRLWDVRPMIYTSEHKWRTLIGAGKWAGEYPLWVAHWHVDEPVMPAPWQGQEWVVWQTGEMDEGLDVNLARAKWLEELKKGQ